MKKQEFLGDRDWWKPEAGPALGRKIDEIMSFGATEEQATDIVEDIYWVVAGEFGS